jgi:tRNA dimethylallyltransferase
MPAYAALDPLLLVILGPTASGKSSLSIALAQQFQGEVVSCDSVAVYREFEIGTAKPSPAERTLVPHHLVDVSHPGEPFTAGEYARQARAAIADISNRGKLPIIVGGTGLYLRALLEGLFPGPQRSDDLRERLRDMAAQRGSAHLHRILSRLDPASAAQIHPNDAPKLIRAIEVCLAARQPMSELWQQRGRDPLTGYRILRLGLNPDREQLYARINARAAAMFEQGLIDETRRLVNQYPQLAADTPFTSLGYKQSAAYLAGELTLAQALTLTQQGHRNYAKRQMTWFRREPDVRWLAGFGDDSAIISQAAEIVGACQSPG